MRTRRLLPSLVVPAALAVLVGSLAALQYRWLGQVSEAERERMKTTLTQRAEAFAKDFDRELLHLYLTFQTESMGLAQRDWESFARRYDAWRGSAEHPEMVRGFYFVETAGSPPPLLQYRPERRTFDPVGWPDGLAPIRDRIGQAHEPTPVGPPSDRTRALIAFRDPVMASVPALLISLPLFQALEVPDSKATFSMKLNSRFLIAHLDREYLESSLLPALATRHFPERDAADYRFAVMDAVNPSQKIFTRGVPEGVVLDPRTADASVPFFALRYDLNNQITARSLMIHGTAQGVGMVANLLPPPPPAPSPVEGPAALPLQPGRSNTPGEGASGRTGSVSVFVEQRGPRVSDFRVTHGVSSPGWQLVLQHTAGSLDAAVGQARRRNLWLSFGILAVLVSGIGLVVVNARRSERLAAQQMDFVATVSHELRTPLTVIRSAAQNLSAGVVHDAGQTRRYGDLIEKEGRRLTDMVEQVLAYAGMSDTRGLASARPTDIALVVQDVLSESGPLLSSAEFETAVDVAPGLPLVSADESAIRRALHNLVTNALKYGADGRWIGVSVRRAPARGTTTNKEEVQIALTDRGRGIDTQDLPHIFEPFFRGRFALERQIHGNGLGLSLVKRIAEAHGGRVTVRSAPGEGTTFTLHLPALSEAEGPALSEVEGLQNPS